MATDMLTALLRETRLLSERLARLSASVSVIEQRIKLASLADRRETTTLIRELRRDLKGLEKRLETQPIAFRQIMDTWWLRIAAIAILGLANIDLKEAISLVLR
jgi:hypothetical protein